MDCSQDTRVHVCLRKSKDFKKISTLKIATGHQWRKVFVTVKHSKKNPVIFIRSRKTAGVKKKWILFTFLSSNWLRKKLRRWSSWPSDSWVLDFSLTSLMNTGMCYGWEHSSICISIFLNLFFFCISKENQNDSKSFNLLKDRWLLISFKILFSIFLSFFFHTSTWWLDIVIFKFKVPGVVTFCRLY